MEVGRDRLQLIDRRAGRLEVTRRQRDVDLGWEQSRPGRSVGGSFGAGRRGKRASDRAFGLVDLTAGQVEEGDPGLCVMAVLVRPVEGFAGRVQVAHPQANLAHLVLRVAHGIQKPEALELDAGLARFLLGLRPLAVEPLQLRAMHATDAWVAAHRLATHPALPFVRPLARPLEIADVSAGGDRVAVDVAGGPELELAGSGGRGGLIDQRETSVQVPREDLAHALEAHRQVVGIEIVVFLGELDRPVGEVDALRQLARHQRSECMEDRDPGVRGRVRR